MIKKIFFIFIVLLFGAGSVFAEESASVSVTATVEGHSQSSDDDTGGGGGGAPSIVSYVNFSGYAYPEAKVYVEENLQSLGVFDAGKDGLFSYNVYGITSGIHDFSVYAKDVNGNFSKNVSFMIDVPGASITNVSNIFIPPTVLADKAKYGGKDQIKFSGYSLPNTSVYVVVNSIDGSLKSFSKAVVSDKNGYFEYNPIGGVFSYGNFLVTTRALHGGVFSSFGNSVDFQIMDKISLSATRPKCVVKGDTNKDCKINLLDFVIELRWYKKPLNAQAKARFDFNGDGKVDLADFSIMAAYWTK